MDPTSEQSRQPAAAGFGGRSLLTAGRRAVEVVNAVRWLEAGDPAYGQVVAGVLARFDEPDVSTVAASGPALAAVVGRLREVLTTTDRDGAAGLLNGLLAEFGAAPRLERHDGWDWHLHVDGGPEAPWDQWLAAVSALALAEWLAGSSGVPWGTCDADGCTVVHLHDGRGGARRYCSPTCSSRERVRRHRARH